MRILSIFVILLTISIAWSGCLESSETDLSWVKFKTTKIDEGLCQLTIKDLTLSKVRLEDMRYSLKNQSGWSQQYGVLPLWNISGKWHGIDITWDDNGTYDPEPGNGMADRNESADGPYSDPHQAQIRIEAVKASYQSNQSHQKSEGTISVSFFDSDFNGLFSDGDFFTIFMNGHPETKHNATSNWKLEIQAYPLTDELLTYSHLC